MKPTFEARCLMVPLNNAPCSSGEGLEHACMEPAGHDGLTHRCECGYLWTERRIALPAAARLRGAPLRWAVRAAVLAVCIAGLWGWSSSRGEAALQRQKAAAMHDALLYFGWDCSFDAVHNSMLCQPILSPAPTTPAREVQ